MFPLFIDVDWRWEYSHCYAGFMIGAFLLGMVLKYAGLYYTFRLSRAKSGIAGVLLTALSGLVDLIGVPAISVISFLLLGTPLLRWLKIDLFGRAHVLVTIALVAVLRAVVDLIALRGFRFNLLQSCANVRVIGFARMGLLFLMNLVCLLAGMTGAYLQAKSRWLVN